MGRSRHLRVLGWTQTPKPVSMAALSSCWKQRSSDNGAGGNSSDLASLRANPKKGRSIGDSHTRVYSYANILCIRCNHWTRLASQKSWRISELGAWYRSFTLSTTLIYPWRQVESTKSSNPRLYRHCYRC